MSDRCVCDEPNYAQAKTWTCPKHGPMRESSGEALLMDAVSGPVSPAERPMLTGTPASPSKAAAERVGAFLAAWARLRDRDDLIYGLYVDPEADESRDLLVSDLRLLLTERQAVSDALSGIKWEQP